MKKLFLLLILSLILFSSCELLNLLLFEDDNSSSYVYKESQQTVNIKYDEEKDKGLGDTMVYLVKLNNSDEAIKASQTGSIPDIQYRSIDEEERYYDTDSFIRQLNKNIITVFNENTDRSADVSRAAGYNEDKVYELDYTDTFYSYVAIKNNKNISEKIQAKCKYVGKHCYVFADISDKNLAAKGINLTTKDYQALGKKFDSCYEKETEILGNPLYYNYNSTYFVPCNEKVIILVSDLFGDAAPGQNGGTVGYFYSGDLFNKNYLDKYYNKSSRTAIHSNECEMFYIDSYFLTTRKDTVYSTLVHEFNHMINYVLKSVKYLSDYPKANKMQACDTWYTEMLSMVTEDLFQNYLGINDSDSPKSRLPYFNMYYNYGFRMWDQSSSNNSLALVMYANTYAFGAYLVRNFGGIELLKAIAQNEYVDEESITAALRNIYPKKTYIDEKTQETRKIDYEYVLRKFYLCLFNTEKPSSQRTDDKQYISFYRQVGKPTDDLYFSAIDIMSIECDVDEGNGKTVHKKIEPVIYNYNDKAVDLGPSGFSVHKIGKKKEVASFTLNASNKKGLEYYSITYVKSDD